MCIGNLVLKCIIIALRERPLKTKKGEKERLRTVILDRAAQFLKRHGRVGSGTNQMMKHAALKRMIEDHLSEKSLTDVEESCAFTSLSSDMQRSKPAHRALYEDYMVRIYALFADALKKQFPGDSREGSQAKATNLYSGLVGTLTMARTMKDPRRAREILEAGKKFLIRTFVPKP